MRYVFSSSGQTLIEVIIAIGLVVLVMTSLVSGVALTVRNNRFARDQAQAKDYNRQTLEWIRAMRDQLGWETFVSILAADGTVTFYCLNFSTPLPTTAAGFRALTNNGTSTCPTDANATVPFRRSLRLTLNAARSQVDAYSEITWEDGNRTHRSFSSVVLRRWR